MRLKNPIEIKQLIETYAVELIENKSDQTAISGVNEIHKVVSGDITFVDTPKYYEKVLNSPATFIIVNQKLECPKGKCLFYAKNPFLVYNQLSKDNFPTAMQAEKLISEDAEIGENTLIYPSVYIGNNVKIGKNCIIYPNVTIYSNSTIGDNVIIHANTVVGSDAFYFNRQGEKYVKMHTIGTTVIEDDVEIGSNCSIDAGVSGVTKIGKGTKLDNQIHIAHGVELGENCLLCAQVAIAGKTIVGNNVVMYGKVGVSKGLKIGDNSVILGTSNVNKDLEGNQKYFGTPAQEARVAMKYAAALKLLPKIIQKLNLFEKNEVEL